jgi:hypothetical protein
MSRLNFTFEQKKNFIDRIGSAIIPGSKIAILADHTANNPYFSLQLIEPNGSYDAIMVSNVRGSSWDRYSIPIPRSFNSEVIQSKYPNMMFVSSTLVTIDDLVNDYGLDEDLVIDFVFKSIRTCVNKHISEWKSYYKDDYAIAFDVISNKTRFKSFEFKSFDECLIKTDLCSFSS